MVPGRDVVGIEFIYIYGNVVTDAAMQDSCGLHLFSVSQSENTGRPIRFEHYITWPEQLLLPKRSTRWR